VAWPSLAAATTLAKTVTLPDTCSVITLHI
jgi:hypothetical protein